MPEKYTFFTYGGGWWMRITSINQLMTILNNDQTSIQLATKELTSFYGGRTTEESFAQNSSGLAKGLKALHQHSGKSLMEDISSFAGAAAAAKVKALAEKGFINVNCVGGWNYLNLPMENVVIKNSTVFPHQSVEDIRIETMAPVEMKYAGVVRPGYRYHYYAYIGKTEVVVDGQHKWDTKKEAYAAALKFIGGTK